MNCKHFVFKLLMNVYLTENDLALGICGKPNIDTYRYCGGITMCNDFECKDKPFSGIVEQDRFNWDEIENETGDCANEPS